MEIKEISLLLLLIVLIIGIILFINSVRANGNHEENIMKCIADNSLLIVSKTCGHCAHQIEILEDSKDYFEIVYLDKNPDLLEKYNLAGVPTWIINEKTEVGFHSIEKLKKLTGC